MQPVAEFMEQRHDLPMREVRGLAADRRTEVAREIRDRMLHARTVATAVDRVVHPRAALLAGTRVEVEIERPLQSARAVADFKVACVGVPGLRNRGIDLDF